MIEYTARIEHHALETTDYRHYRSDSLEKVVTACKEYAKEYTFDYKDNIDFEQHSDREYRIYETNKQGKRVGETIGSFTISLYAPPVIQNL